MSTPPVSASSRPTMRSRLRPVGHRHRDSLDRRRACRVDSAGAKALARASTTPGPPVNPDSTMTVSPKAGRVATRLSPSTGDVGRLTRDARAQPCRQAGGHIGRDHSGAEQHPVGLPRRRLEASTSGCDRPPAERRVVGHQYLPELRGRRARPPSCRRSRTRATNAVTSPPSAGGLGQHAQTLVGELAVVVMNVTRAVSYEPPLGQDRHDLVGRVAARILDLDALGLRHRRGDRPHHVAGAVGSHPCRVEPGVGEAELVRAASSWRP